MKKLNQDAVMSIMNSILGGGKTFHSALLVFPTEMEHFEALSFLRSQHSATNLIKDFKIVPLVFEKKSNNFEGIVANMIHGLLFGKFSVLKSPMFVHHSDLGQLISIVECICPLQSTVGLACDPGVPLVKIHSQSLDRNVKYYGGKDDILKFQRKLDKDMVPVDDDDDANIEIAEDTTADIPSTSTTPAKSASDKLNDSGIVDPSPGSSSVSRSLSAQFESLGDL